MPADRIEIGEEHGTKRTFVWVLDWPGWCRGAKDTPLAIDSLLEHAPRYAVVAQAAGLTLPEVSPRDVTMVESVGGGTGTDFGVPSAIADSDRRPTTTGQAERLAALVEAAWTILDRVAATAPAELRKGPRGGGRDRDKMLGHVIEADGAYAHELGLRLQPGSLEDRPTVDALRAAILEVLRRPSDGAPLAGRRWPVRYAARRIAWHALDHAWEMEDRADPG